MRITRIAGAYVFTASNELCQWLQGCLRKRWLYQMAEFDYEVFAMETLCAYNYRINSTIGTDRVDFTNRFLSWTPR